jgi:hypothetical protein
MIGVLDYFRQEGMVYNEDNEIQQVSYNNTVMRTGRCTTL